MCLRGPRANRDGKTCHKPTVVRDARSSRPLTEKGLGPVPFIEISTGFWSPSQLSRRVSAGAVDFSRDGHRLESVPKEAGRVREPVQLVRQQSGAFS